jgi:hypothetical protein
MTKKQAGPGEVEVRWSYRPDDRAKQGTTEFLPRDLARQKVAEGLAVLVPPATEPEVEDATEVEPARPAAKKTTAPAQSSS